MSSKLFSVPLSDVAKIRNWFATRGGCVIWHNQEIGNNTRPDMLTPARHEDGTAARPPHWSMGNPTLVCADPPNPDPALVAEFPRAPIVGPDVLEVTDRTPVIPPNAWFPPCDYCKGTGRRSLATLADVRAQTVEEIRAVLAQDDRYKRGEHAMDNDTCTCWACDGTGHTDRHVTVKIRRHYWGVDISETGKRLAARAAKKLGPDVQWDWTGYLPGIAEIIFYREVVSEFSLA